MAPSTRYHHGIIAAIIATLFICLIILPSKSDEKEKMMPSIEAKSNKPVLGSMPPKCWHKCLGCSPCIATLVAPPNHVLRHVISSASYDYGNNNNHDSYYLVAWKCKCGNKLFQP